MFVVLNRFHIAAMQAKGCNIAPQALEKRRRELVGYIARIKQVRGAQITAALVGILKEMAQTALERGDKRPAHFIPDGILTRAIREVQEAKGLRAENFGGMAIGV